MVEIVGYDKEVIKKCTCKECGAVLRYGKHEVKSYHGTDWSGGPDGREWITCPSCGNDVTIRSW